MSRKDINIAKALKKKLTGLVQILEYKVFGSRARGDAGPYSDLDIFLKVSRLTKKQKDKIVEAAWEVGFENHVVICPVIYTKDEVENTPLRSSPLVLVVNEEGIAV